MHFFYKSGINNLIYLLPFIVIYVIFVIYPILNNFYISFFDWNGISLKKTFVGLENYIEMLNSRVLSTAIKNNFIFLVLSVFFQTSFGFFLALLLNRKIAGRNIYRSVIFFPCVMAPVIVGFIFVGLINYSYGIINTF